MVALISPLSLIENHFQILCVRAKFRPSLLSSFPSILTLGQRRFYMYFISDKNENYIWISKLYVFTWRKSKRRKICKRTLNSNTIYFIVCPCNLISYDNIDKPSPRQNPIYDISWLISPNMSSIIIKLNFSKYWLASTRKLWNRYSKFGISIALVLKFRPSR